MAQNDLANLGQRIHSVIDHCVLAWKSTTPLPSMLAGVENIRMGVDDLTVYLCRKGEIDQVITRKIPGKDYWTIEERPSPVVEFTRCYEENGLVRRGRFYFQSTYYDERKQHVTKSEATCLLARQLFEIVDDSSVFDVELKANVFPEAARLRSVGAVRFVV